MRPLALSASSLKMITANVKMPTAKTDWRGSSPQLMSQNVSILSDNSNLASAAAGTCGMKKKKKKKRVKAPKTMRALDISRPGRRSRCRAWTWETFPAARTKSLTCKSQTLNQWRLYDYSQSLMLPGLSEG